MTRPEPSHPAPVPGRPSWPERLGHAVREARRSRTRSTLWRLTAPLVFVTAGVLFVASANTSGGTDIRGGRITDLAGLAEAESNQLEELRDRQAALTAEIEELSATLEETESAAVVEQARALREPAGLEPVRGPGLTITLDDAPDTVMDTADPEKIGNLVVHQQDIQAVVNALWAGGAEAMTVQGQRIVSTTGIRCVGNTVVLHDVPYAPPYVISAIGPTGTMLAAVDANPYIDFYLQAVERYQLGWDVQVEPELDMPGYVGSTTLQHASPAGDPALAGSAAGAP